MLALADQHRERPQGTARGCSRVVEEDPIVSNECNHSTTTTVIIALAGSLFAGCAQEDDPPPPEERVHEASDALGFTFDYPIAKTVELPNLFAIPGYENLEIPVYESFGTQGPPILLVHGNSASSRAYVKQVFSLFGATRKLYLLDLPGYGRSEKVDPGRAFPVDPNTGLPEGFAEYQIGLVEAVATVANDPALAPEVFVGWSVGGDVLLLTQGAGLLPAAKGLFIFGTAPAGANPPTAEPPFKGPFVPGLPLSTLASLGFAFVADANSPHGFNLDGEFTDAPPVHAAPPTSRAPTVGDAYVRAFFNPIRRRFALFPKFFIDDAFDRTDRDARASLGVIGLGLAPPGALPDELDVLQNLEGDPSDPSDDIPIAVLVGGSDAFVNAQYLEDLKAAGYLPTLWHNDIISVPGAGHAIQFERPALFNAVLSQFIHSL